MSPIIAYVIIDLALWICLASPPEVIKRIPAQTIINNATTPPKRRKVFAALRKTVGRQLSWATPDLIQEVGQGRPI